MAVASESRRCLPDAFPAKRPARKERRGGVSLSPRVDMAMLQMYIKLCMGFSGPGMPWPEYEPGRWTIPWGRNTGTSELSNFSHFLIEPSP
jgi:hypothetical protein